jgi:prophage regulatory protein
MATRLLKAPEVFDRHQIRNSTLYQQIQDGLFTPPVKMGANRSVWPERESDAIICARIAGRTDAEIRELVRQLVADRAKLADRITA